MELQKPVIAYTAATNLESHMIVELLHNNGVPAHAVEDRSGPSLWMGGTIGQFHKPNIWVDESNVQEASKLIQGFEEKKRARNKPNTGSGELISVVCEDCGANTSFSGSLNGTAQKCSQCKAFIDVGDSSLDVDFGEPVE